jgi:hypothetical protein
MSDLKAQVIARFIAVNGEHRMTEADDAYVSEYFVPLENLCAARSLRPDVVRQHMLEQRLPLPSYIRSDRTEMVPADLLELSEHAGGIERLGQWFTAHWTDPGRASDEWRSYLSGQYVCLRSVTPANIQRKDALVGAIESALDNPQPLSGRWLTDLHRLVDELDELEPPFAPYDRLRFGRPVSRDTAIDAVRVRFPRVHESAARTSQLAG